jgi:signal transduction histidine kinase
MLAGAVELEVPATYGYSALLFPFRGMKLAHPKARVITAVVGGILLLLVPVVSWFVSWLDRLANTSLLGPSRSVELEHRVKTLSQSRAGVVDAADAERRRIERDLHDGAQRRLVSLAMNLGLARATLTRLASRGEPGDRGCPRRGQRSAHRAAQPGPRSAPTEIIVELPCES